MPTNFRSHDKYSTGLDYFINTRLKLASIIGFSSPPHSLIDLPFQIYENSNNNTTISSNISYAKEQNNTHSRRKFKWTQLSTNEYVTIDNIRNILMFIQNPNDTLLSDAIEPLDLLESPWMSVSLSVTTSPFHCIKTTTTTNTKTNTKTTTASDTTSHNQSRIKYNVTNNNHHHVCYRNVSFSITLKTIVPIITSTSIQEMQAKKLRRHSRKSSLLVVLDKIIREGMEEKKKQEKEKEMDVLEVVWCGSERARSLWKYIISHHHHHRHSHRDTSSNISNPLSCTNSDNNNTSSSCCSSDGAMKTSNSVHGGFTSGMTTFTTDVIDSRALEVQISLTTTNFNSVYKAHVHVTQPLPFFLQPIWSSAHLTTLTVEGKELSSIPLLDLPSFRLQHSFASSGSSSSNDGNHLEASTLSALSFDLILEPLTMTYITLKCLKRFIIREKQAADASRGLELTPAIANVIYTRSLSSSSSSFSSATIINDINGNTTELLSVHCKNSHEKNDNHGYIDYDFICDGILLVGTSAIISLPITDASMPFNVITLVSTCLAFLFGSMINTLVRKSSRKKGAQLYEKVEGIKEVEQAGGDLENINSNPLQVVEVPRRPIVAEPEQPTANDTQKKIVIRRKLTVSRIVLFIGTENRHRSNSGYMPVGLRSFPALIELSIPERTAAR
eukprot:gene3764-7474_t